MNSCKSQHEVNKVGMCAKYAGVTLGSQLKKYHVMCRNYV